MASLLFQYELIPEWHVYCCFHLNHRYIWSADSLVNPEVFNFPQVVNSVVMNHVSIADGCTIQNSVICSNVQLQERVVLKDCQVIRTSQLLHFPLRPFLMRRRHLILCFAFQVGANFVVTTGSECKGEALAKKEK